MAHPGETNAAAVAAMANSLFSAIWSYACELLTADLHASFLV
jgi:hypothetical protein